MARCRCGLPTLPPRAAGHVRTRLVAQPFVHNAAALAARHLPAHHGISERRRGQLEPLTNMQLVPQLEALLRSARMARGCGRTTCARIDHLLPRRLRHLVVTLGSHEVVLLRSRAPSLFVLNVRRCDRCTCALCRLRTRNRSSPLRRFSPWCLVGTPASPEGAHIVSPQSRARDLQLQRAREQLASRAKRALPRALLERRHLLEVSAQVLWARERLKELVPPVEGRARVAQAGGSSGVFSLASPLSSSFYAAHGRGIHGRIVLTFLLS